MSAPDIINAGDFMRGQRDCQKGVEHKPGQSEDYDRGYRAEYEWQEVKTAISESQERRYGSRKAI